MTGTAPPVRVRRGLPRTPGGGPWPTAAIPIPDSAFAPSDAAPSPKQIPSSVVAAAGPSVTTRRLRRGLPRHAGGDAWPPASDASASDAGNPAVAVSATAAAGTAASGSAAAPVLTRRDLREGRLRRGLPRMHGGKPWPDGAARRSLPPTPPTASVAPAVSPGPAREATVRRGPAAPLTSARTAWAGVAVRPVAAPEPTRHGPFTMPQWWGASAIAGVAVLFVGAMAVSAARFLLSTPGGQDFLAAYPGEYHLPGSAPVGFPVWLGWQHFLNAFFLVLIIRSGLQVRRQKRPTAFWSSRRGGRKISLALWFHQSLDVLWLLNGVIFVVLLFTTGQWMRIVPTSWEVLPNAASAALQYLSLDWPTENGWVNYNALQQLAYGAVVFVAAPLAAITGVRMSGVWPARAERLSRAYPIEWARAVHFPVMIFFVVFIVMHVALVLATGALRNLNHMYAVQGSTDPAAYADNWLGFWIFAASALAMVAAWVAARPLVLTPIARLFGTVSAR